MGNELTIGHDEEILESEDLDDLSNISYFIINKDKAQDENNEISYIDYDPYPVQSIRRKSLDKDNSTKNPGIQQIYRQSLTSGFKLTNGENINLAYELSYIIKSIEHSKYILALQSGWDDDNALEIAPQIWDKAIKFLSDYSLHLYKSYYIKIQAPDINPCRNGSIDLSWRTKNARLLINIDNKDLASYYGDNYNYINGIEGFVQFNQVQEFLATWMKFLA